MSTEVCRKFPEHVQGNVGIVTYIKNGQYLICETSEARKYTDNEN
jgi:hypothetical protein